MPAPDDRLFLDWSHVQKGHLEMTLDPDRVTEKGVSLHAPAGERGLVPRPLRGLPVRRLPPDAHRGAADPLLPRHAERARLGLGYGLREPTPSGLARRPPRPAQGRGTRPLDGFRLADCDPFNANDTEATITWNVSCDRSALAGKKVIVQFRLRRARLFAYRRADDQGGKAEERTIV